LSFCKWEDQELNALADKAYPSTKSSSCKKFSTTIVPRMFDEFVSEKKQLIDDNFVSITSDGWKHSNQHLLR
jgi:hypothetical protein